MTWSQKSHSTIYLMAYWLHRSVPLNKRQDCTRKNTGGGNHQSRANRLILQIEVYTEVETSGMKTTSYLTSFLLMSNLWLGNIKTSISYLAIYSYFHSTKIYWGSATCQALWSVLGSVQFSSVTQSCPTLCNPMNRSTPCLPVHHHLLEFTQTHVHRVHDAIQPSHPRSSPSPPAPNPSQHQSLFQRVNSSHEVAKVLEFQL